MPEWLRRRPREGGAGSADEREELLLRAAAASFPVALAAHPSGFGCSCDRIGCPTPGMHPVSFAWQTQSTTDQDQVRRWLRTQPQANFVTATGRVHDVLDVPAEAGEAALRRLEASGVPAGPVASCGPDRYLFFTITRASQDEDEWWPCALDCSPETPDEHPGLRWHCRGSYVLLPPSRHPSGKAVTWLRGPEHPLPDPLPLLEVLADTCDAVATREAAEEEAAEAAEAAETERLLGR